MGIYDRDYYQEKGRGYLDALVPESSVSKWLVALFVLMFIVQLATLPLEASISPVTTALALVPSLVLEGEVWRPFTFWLTIDFGWWAFLFFLIYLWVFGSDVEQIHGGKEFLFYFIAAAWFGGAAGFLWAWSFGLESVVIVGPAGAMSALMFLIAWHFPTRQINLFGVLPIPIWIFALLPLLNDAYGMYAGNRSSSPRVIVHLADIGFSWLYFTQNWRLSSFASFQDWRRRRTRSQLRLYAAPSPTEEPVSVAASSYPEMDEHFEAKVDAVLDKVSRSGQSSLTEKERQILLKASEIYRRRRL